MYARLSGIISDDMSCTGELLWRCWSKHEREVCTHARTIPLKCMSGGLRCPFRRDRAWYNLDRSGDTGNFRRGTVNQSTHHDHHVIHPRLRQSAGSCGPPMAIGRVKAEICADHAVLAHAVRSRHCDHAGRANCSFAPWLAALGCCGHEGEACFRRGAACVTSLPW